MNEGLRPYTMARSHLDFRISTAVWGTALAVTLLVTTGASWAQARDQPGPFGQGPVVGRTVWSLAGFQPEERSDPRRWWARLAVALVVVTVLLALGAAAGANSTLARSAGVTAALSLVAEVVLLIVIRDGYFRPAPGMVAALLVTAALGAWGFIVAGLTAGYDTWPDQ